MVRTNPVQDKKRNINAGRDNDRDELHLVAYFQWTMKWMHSRRRGFGNESRKDEPLLLSHCAYTVSQTLENAYATAKSKGKPCSGGNETIPSTAMFQLEAGRLPHQFWLNRGCLVQMIYKQSSVVLVEYFHCMSIMFLIPSRPFG